MTVATDYVAHALLFRGFFVEEVGKIAIDSRSFNRHGAVNVHREWFEDPGAKQLLQMIENLLAPAHGKRRNEDARLLLNSVLNDGAKLGKSLFQRFVVAIAIS